MNAGVAAAGALMLALQAACAVSRTGAPSPSGPPAARADLLLSARQLSELIANPDVVVLHVGTSEAEFRRGHLPGARFLPLRSILAERDSTPNELPPDAHLDSVFESVGVSNGSRVILYGEPLAAARAFFTLDYLGHGDRSALLDGSLAAWTGEGYPLSTEVTPTPRGDFHPRPDPQRLAEAEWIRDHLGEPGVALLDSRPAAEYSGTIRGAGVARGGHIPGAGNLFWGETLQRDSPRTLLDPETLRASFEAAGAVPGRVVVSYCRSGMQSSFTHFVARYLGYESRMYDGSFVDWSRRAELPVDRR